MRLERGVSLSSVCAVGIYAIATVGALSSPSNAYAAQTEQVGAAGCGLGSVIWGKESQVLAATSNMTGTQTLGILFGTSNCAPKSKKAAVIEFVQTNQIALSNDASRGSGETVKALSEILGCSNSQALGTVLKENYADIFARKKNDPVGITERITETVERSHFLSRSCDHG